MIFHFVEGVAFINAYSEILIKVYSEMGI